MKALLPPLSSASADGHRRAYRAIACKSYVLSVQSSQALPVDLNTRSSTRSKYFLEHVTAMRALIEHILVDVTKHTQSSNFQTQKSKI